MNQIKKIGNAAPHMLSNTLLSYRPPTCAPSRNAPVHFTFCSSSHGIYEKSQLWPAGSTPLLVLRNFPSGSTKAAAPSPT